MQGTQRNKYKKIFLFQKNNLIVLKTKRNARKILKK